MVTASTSVPEATSFHASVASSASSGWISSRIAMPASRLGSQPRLAQDGDA
jgi:hypothetical protein